MSDMLIWIAFLAVFAFIAVLMRAAYRAMRESISGVSTVRESAPGRRSGGIAPLLMLAALAGVGWWWFASGGFSDAEIAVLRADIKAKYEERRAVHVETVSLVRESDRKLTGFVRLHIDGGEDVFMGCAVTRDESKTLWQCR